MTPESPHEISTLSFTEVTSIPLFDEITDGELFMIALSNNTTKLTHGLHRFPAKYIPQVPIWALDSFGSRQTVCLDPFMGSGTTLVEGLIRGGTTIGTDIDPLARFIARAKIADVDHERIRVMGASIMASWPGEHIETQGLRAPMPDIDNFGHWFARPQWAKAQALVDRILDLDATVAERDFLLAVFSSVLRWVSNADDQSQKTYVSGTRPKEPPPIEVQFRRFLSRAVNGLEELNRKRHSEARAVILDDADATRLGLPEASVDLIVTSPPYLDSVDYPYNLMLEYFWLGPRIGVPDRKAFNALRRTPVGAKQPAACLPLPPVIEAMIDLSTLSAGRRRAATTYFSMMDTHLAEAARCLKDGGRYVLVIGNSQTRSGMLPVHEVIVKLAASHGLVLERSFGYRVRRHYMKFPRSGRGGIILIDWVLTLRKQPDMKAGRLPRSTWVSLPPSSVAN
ncbi:hypothetical protein [Mycolicibacterium fortuitum]|jgi:hypothetical protein|uniref:hypothetical protein n=1 Tax=Mycolicibacterium fortuitum TaxID=1766 RepID=UPI003AAC7ED8